MPKIWSNGQAARWTFSGTDWDWSNITLDGSVNSFQFVPDPDDGGLQGDFSIGTGSATSAYPSKQSTYNYNHTEYEVEPAGGTFSFDMLSRELTYWHKIAPVFWSYQYTKDGNEFSRGECEAFVTGGTNVATPTHYEITYSPVDTRQIYTITYGLLTTSDDTTNTTYQVSKSDSTDLTVNFKIGPNNTPESAYTEIWNVGFINAKEDNREEYYTGDYSKVKHRNTPWHGSSIPDDARVIDASSTEKKEFCLLKMWQRPNILYYVHMKFINPSYTNYDVAATSAVMETYTINWNKKEQDILLYIEFGVSPNGGKTIWWNGVESDSSIGGETGQKLVERGITTVVPNDINKYITIIQLNYSLLPNSERDGYSTTSRYVITPDDATVHGTKAFKYVRFTIRTSGENNEFYNIPEDVKQQYAVLNVTDEETSTTATSDDDSGINSSKQRNGLYWAKYPAGSQSSVSFYIGRKHSTNDWNTTIHLDLFYKKDSMKYIGATDGK